MSGKGTNGPRSTDGDGSDVWIVVPAYNEQARLAATLASLDACGHQVVVVDDGSTDQTREIAVEANVWSLRHLFNCGQGAALQTGIDFALRRGAEIIVTFDADGQHAVEEIERLVDPIRSGQVDVVLGSRFLGSTVGLPRSRWLILKLGVLFTRLFSRVRVTDTHNGLRAFSRDAARSIRITMGGMAHASEILEQVRQHNLRYCEVPVTITYFDETLEKGQSNWNGLRIVARLFVGRIVR
ncbi:MAG: glycosyltransferase family 2 protein [Pirellulales bacterium]